MGILNVTPDSFFDGGKYTCEDQILNKTSKMLMDGASIIDIGGQSSRPGATFVSEKEELKRVIPAIKSIAKRFPEAIISIDTFRGNVAKQAVAEGASMVNDISAGNLDNRMFDTIASLHVPYVLMHMQGSPSTMQQAPRYENVVKEIMLFLARKVNELRLLGVKDIILDPGFGFGKTLDHNYDILKQLDEFSIFRLPVIAGLSRKSMINKVIETKPDESLNGTTVLNTLALTKGASILRVHDVKEAKEAIKLLQNT